MPLYSVESCRQLTKETKGGEYLLLKSGPIGLAQSADGATFYAQGKLDLQTSLNEAKR